MQAKRIVGAIALLLLFTDIGLAQRDLLDEPRRLEQITFSPPQNASIRLSSGVRRAGKIVSISRESMVYQVGRDNKEVSIEIDDIQRVNIVAQDFGYEPARDDFERLKTMSRRITYMSVQTVETYVPPPEGSTPDDPPAVVVNPDPPSIPESRPEMRPETVPTTDEPPSTPGTSDPVTQASNEEIPEGDPAPGTLILFCGNCSGRLPLSVKNGDRCPHCERVFWDAAGASNSGTGAARPQGAFSPGTSDPGGAAYPTAAGDTPEGGTAVDATSAPASGGGNVVARDTSLADVPTWMKVGFFVGILAIGWLILQRR